MGYLQTPTNLSDELLEEYCYQSDKICDFFNLIMKNGFYESGCDYNLYICKWSGEDGFLSLRECGIERIDNYSLLIKKR